MPNGGGPNSHEIRSVLRWLTNPQRLLPVSRFKIPHLVSNLRDGFKYLILSSTAVARVTFSHTFYCLKPSATAASQGGVLCCSLGGGQQPRRRRLHMYLSAPSSRTARCMTSLPGSLFYALGWVVLGRNTDEHCPTRRSSVSRARRPKLIFVRERKASRHVTCG